ncbi:MAG: 4-alpha-glucanotransferase, partial [Zetaproteobacteria bacterium]
MLLHPTALPEPGLGAGAERWLHWLAEHRVRVWQLLPVHPTDHSPYSARSVFAGNPAWLDDAWLVHEGFLPPEAAGAPRKARDAALVQRTERRLREDPALAEDWEA